MANPSFQIDRSVIQRILMVPGESAAACHAEKVNRDGSSAFSESFAENLPSAHENAVDEETLFGMGSFMKPIIATALGFIIEEPSVLVGQPAEIQRIMKGAWTKYAFTVLNELRNARNRPTIRPSTRLTPTVSQLLSHIKSFPPDPRYLFGPDSSFLMSDQIFEDVVANLGDRPGESADALYSNWNFAIAGMIVKEVMGKELSEALKELVLEPLEMNHTVLDLKAFEIHKRKIAPAFIETIDEGCQLVSPPCYLHDTIELAVGGGYTCAADIAKLLRFLSKKHFAGEWEPFFKAHKVGNGPFSNWSTVLGNYGDLNSQVVRIQSYDWTDRTESYQLGVSDPKFGSHKVIAKAGAVKGYSCHFFWVPGDGIFVIVLTNSSGIIDTSNHIGLYILQQVLKLQPSVDFVSEAKKIHQGRVERLRSFRSTHVPSHHQPFSPEELAKLVGVYEHELSRQKIHISYDGQRAEAFFDGNSSEHEKRTCALRIVRVSGDTLTLQPPHDNTTIDGYDDAWFGLKFKMHIKEGRVSALMVMPTPNLSTGDDVYERVI
jgi:CubicO group peptidase (beta-lactamase class C family)